VLRRLFLTACRDWLSGESSILSRRCIASDNLVNTTRSKKQPRQHGISEVLLCHKGLQLNCAV